MAVQDYIDHVLNALPKWFSRPRTLENVKAFAEIMQDAEDQTSFWKSMSYILSATVDGPDWLNQHAVDRNTRRQQNESDAALRNRLRTFPEALHPQALLDSAQSIVDAEGITGTGPVAILELRRDRAFFGTRQNQSGTGGKFVVNGSVITFEPTTSYSAPSLFGEVASAKLSLSGSITSGNDGTFDIEGYVIDAIKYTNGSAFGEEDPGVAWVLTKYDSSGNLLDGFKRPYLSRGYRMGDNRAAIVLILPFGCSQSTENAVKEMLRQKKGAGVVALVECRANP